MEPVKVTVEVTQADIDIGCKKDCLNCPVAVALERATGKMWSVLGTCARRPAEFEVYLLPESARQFIGAFDEGEPVKPFTFEFSW